MIPERIMDRGDENHLCFENVLQIVLTIMGGATAMVISLLLLSFAPEDGLILSNQAGAHVRNLCGVPGAYLSGYLYGVIGMGSWLIPAYLAWECLLPWRHRWVRRAAWIVFANALLVVLGSFGRWNLHPGPWSWGGALGEALSLIWHQTVGPIATPLAWTMMLGLLLYILFPMSGRCRKR